MKKRFTKVLCTILAFCSLLGSSAVSATAANEISPYYNNVNTVTSSAIINDNGVLTVNYSYSGSSSVTTKAIITTYVEKRVLGLFWKRVNIGTNDNEWVDIIQNHRYDGYRSFQLSASGTYRVTIIYEIYGTGGAFDTIEHTIKRTY